MPPKFPVEIPPAKKEHWQEEPVKGWLDPWEYFIQDQVKQKYPELLALTPRRMQVVDPKWAGRDEESRLQWWACFLWALAGPESNRSRTMIYVEGTMDKDPVTGFQVRSEGLLQLSYQDVPNYKYKGEISWEKDRELARFDYETKAKFGDGLRTLHSAYANLDLGLFIMRKHLVEFNSDRSFEDALGKYWYVMQTRNKEEFAQVLAGLKTRGMR